MIAKGTNAARKRDQGEGVNKNQHSTNIGPVPICMIFRLSLLLINPRSAAKSFNRNQINEIIKVAIVAKKSLFNM